MVNKIFEEIKNLGYSHEDALKILKAEKERVEAIEEPDPEPIPEVEPVPLVKDESHEIIKPDKPIDTKDIKKIISSEVQLEVKRQLKMKRGSPPEMRDPLPGEDFVKNTITKNLYEIIV